MKIIERYEIQIQGTGYLNSGYEDFWVQDDQGTRNTVKIPNHPDIIKAFCLLNEHDALRHLDGLEPNISTNYREIAEAQEHNERIEEFLQNQGSSSPFRNPGYQNLNYPSLLRKIVPEPAWEAKWFVWSKDISLMFKLAWVK